MADFSLQDAVALVVSRGSPVLCVDTCSLLDIIREPYRERKAGLSIQPAEVITEAHKNGHLTILAAPTIPMELGRNTPTVVEELRRELRRLDEQINRAVSAAAACGVHLTPTFSFENSPLAYTLELRIQTLVAQFVQLADDDGAASKAMARAIHQTRPARRGSVLDAVIIEHYLEVGRRLVAEGYRLPLVFASSNTSDYCEGRALHPDLAPDFIAANVKYVTDLRLAVRALGL